MIKEIVLQSINDTNKLAEEISKKLSVGSVVALYGDLGSGKTYFTSQLCKLLGSDDIVSSPSYLIMHEYSAKYPIYHLDLYRLSSEEEVLELGLDEIFEKGVTIIEWPKLAEFILPKDTIKLYWKIQSDKRIVKMDLPA